MRVTAIAALAIILIVAEAPLRELLRAGRYRALRANLKPHAPPLNLSRVLEVGRGRTSRLQAAVLTARRRASPARS